jgi:hemoglobin-like flavoprotein
MSLDLKALTTSFDLVAPRGDELMNDFFSRLVATVPAVRPLFPADLERQKTIVLAMLALLRESLHNLDEIAPTLHKVGACNAAYGARAEHYPRVGAKLIASMAAIAGQDWKPEYEREWSAAFEIIAAEMLQGAARTALEAA